MKVLKQLTFAVGAFSALQASAQTQAPPAQDWLTSEFRALGTEVVDTLISSGISEVDEIPLSELRRHINTADTFFANGVKKLFESGNEVDALNIPDTHRVLIRPESWLKATNSQRRFLVIHETLGLMRAHDETYAHSSAIVAQYQAISGDTGDEPRKQFPEMEFNSIPEVAEKMIRYLVAKREQGVTCDADAYLDASQWTILQYAMALDEVMAPVPVDTSLLDALSKDPAVSRQMQSSLNFTALTRHWGRLPSPVQLMRYAPGTRWQSGGDTMELQKDGTYQLTRANGTRETARWDGANGEVYVIQAQGKYPMLSFRLVRADREDPRVWTQLPDTCASSVLPASPLNPKDTIATCELLNSHDVFDLVTDVNQLKATGRTSFKLCEADHTRCWGDDKSWIIQRTDSGQLSISGQWAYSTMISAALFEVNGFSSGSTLLGMNEIFYPKMNQQIDPVRLGFEGIRCEISVRNVK